ncbi:TPA: hypothetical protein IAC10_13245 [Candidatus Scatousia excrementigallinarum]|uniref:Uncharacterized protein n=1 Tax=Candidatus Scatousia excrementigallinarum TaxID=2840935 RepID=A0A9D1JPS9_9BACT|nr:hypothetical protein [Candidatus Scatousia excrementigallinarum]
MDKLQKKVKEQMDSDKQSFDEWFNANRGQLSRFDNEQTAEVNIGGDTLARSRKVWIALIAAILMLAICLSVILPLTLNDNFSDSGFGDDSVYQLEMTDEELSAVLGEYPFLSDMWITTSLTVKLHDDASDVMDIIGGEVETQSDYYLITALIEYNPNYHFGYRSVYESLENRVSVNDWDISYEQTSIDASGLYVYMLRMEDSGGQVVYMEVHCFENNIDYILYHFIS